MKKNLLVALMSIMSVALFAQTKPLFATFTTSVAKANAFYFTLVSSVPGNTAEIDWGTETVITTAELDMVVGTDTPSGFATEGGEVTIKIYGENIVGITCSTKSLINMTFVKPEMIKDLSIQGNQLGNYDFSKFTALEVLEFSKNGATALDFSSNTALRKLTVSENTLTSLNISKNVELENLTANNCGMSSFDFTANTKLVNLLLSNNSLTDVQAVLATLSADATTITMLKCNLTAIDLSRFTKLSSLHLGNNPLNSLVLGEKSELKTLHLSIAGNATTGVAHNLTSLDLSAYPNLATINLNGVATLRNSLTAVTLTSAGTAASDVSLNASYNNLEQIDISGIPNMKSLNIAGNKFKMSEIPAKPYAMMTGYTYHPQVPMELAATLASGVTLDLSAENNLLGETALAEPAVPQTTTYVWKKADGTALAAGTDYTVVEAGKFSFSSALVGTSVFCEMATPAFSKFTGTNIFKTSTIQIVDASNIEQDELKALRIIAIDGGLMITNLENNAAVNVYSVDGRLVKSFTASGSTSIALQKGAYLVRVNNELLKAAVK